MTANANVVPDREQLIAGLYRATKTPQLVEVPALTFLMIDGHGDPNTSVEYQDAIQALYTLSYGVKFAIKRVRGSQLQGVTAGRSVVGGGPGSVHRWRQGSLGLDGDDPATGRALR